MSLKKEPKRYNVRLKDFGQIQKLTCFSHPIFNPDGIPAEKSERQRQVEQECRELNKKYRYKYRERVRTDSMKRAKDKAFEIAFSNDFQYFITFTLDKNHIDRYDPHEIVKKLNTWLGNKVRRNGLQYLIFPEYHKDKAIHFHGLCSGNLTLTDSGKQTKDGHAIFNCESWSYGFSTVMEIYGIKERVVNYVVKYITKDCQKIFGKYYLSGGKNLNREVPTTYYNIDFDAFQGERYAISDSSDFVKYRTDLVGQTDSL